MASNRVVDISLGGWLALDYAVRRRARVAALSLLSPAGIGSRNQLFMLKAIVMLMLGKFGVRRAMSAVAGKSPVTTPLAQYMTLIFENFRPRREAPPVLSDAELQALSSPVQVIVGAKDTMLRSAETRERATRLLPQAEVIALEDAGHMLPPQTARIIAFLDRLPSRVAG